MRRRLVVIGLLLLLSVSVFRSIVDGTPLAVAVDSTASTILEGAWELLQNPVVLIAIAVNVTLYLYRKYLPTLLAAITEVTAGTFSAKFDPSLLTSPPDRQPGIQGENKRKEVVEAAVISVHPELAWLLLKVANSPVEVKELLSTVKRERVLDTEEVALGYLYGAFDSLQPLIINRVGRVEGGEEYEGQIIIEIDPEVVTLLAAKVQAEKPSIGNQD